MAQIINLRTTRLHGNLSIKFHNLSQNCNRSLKSVAIELPCEIHPTTIGAHRVDKAFQVTLLKDEAQNFLNTLSECAFLANENKQALRIEVPQIRTCHLLEFRAGSSITDHSGRETFPRNRIWRRPECSETLRAL